MMPLLVEPVLTPLGNGNPVGRDVFFLRDLFFSLDGRADEFFCVGEGVFYCAVWSVAARYYLFSAIQQYLNFAICLGDEHFERQLQGEGRIVLHQWCADSSVNHR